MSRCNDMMRQGPAAAAAVAASACAVVLCISTVRLVWQGWLPVPFGDQWQQLVAEHDATFAWLASMHNEHRIFVPRLLFLLDRWVSRERNAVDLAANLSMQAAFVCILVDLLRREWRPSFTAAALLTGCTASLAFWAVQWENFTWGFQVQIFGVVLGTLIVLHRVAFGGRSWPSLLVTLVAMVCTALTLSTGFLAAVIAVPLASWVGRPRRDIVIFELAAAALFGLTAASLDHGGPDAGRVDGVLYHLPHVAIYAVVALGGPIGDGLQNLLAIDNVVMSFCAGMVGLALFACLLPSVLSGPRSPRAAMLSALATYGCLTAAATAVGRWSLGPAQAMSSRYTTPMLAFWIALCFLLRLGVSSMGRMRAGAALALPTGLAVLALASQGAFVDMARQFVDARAEAIPALAAGVADPAAIRDSGMAGPDPLTHLAALKAAQASLFAEPWLGWSGERLAEHAVLSNPSRCAGQIDDVESVATGPRGGSRVRGRVRIAGSARLLRLVLTDEAGTVVGYGVAPPFRDVSAADGVASWTGAAAVISGRALVAYALLRDGSACRLVQSDGASIGTATLAAGLSGGLLPRDGGGRESRGSCRRMTHDSNSSVSMMELFAPALSRNCESRL